MPHPLYRVVSVQIMAPYTLRVGFDDNTERIICFEPVLIGELYGPLRNLEIFNWVRVDPEAHTIVWPNGADFDPAILHDWPDYLEELTARARQWEVLRLESIRNEGVGPDDPFYCIGQLADARGEGLTNEEMDRIIYEV